MEVQGMARLAIRHRTTPEESYFGIMKKKWKQDVQGSKLMGGI